MHRLLRLLPVLLLSVACGPEARFERFVRLSSEVPAFGGLGQQDDGTWIVYTRDAARVEEAREAVEGLFPAGPDEFVILDRPRTGQASETLKDQAGSASSAGAHSFDFDEITGYLRIRVETPESVRPVGDALVEAGVPEDQTILQVDFRIVAAGLRRLPEGGGE